MKNRTYISFLNEITEGEIFEGLLGYGLFSDALPPVFTSESFMLYCKKKQDSFSDNGCDYIKYETIRNISIPRIISIPNPFAYSNLCNHIQKYWTKMKNKFQENTYGQKYKISQIHIRKMKNSKALFKINYKNFFDKDNENDNKAYSKEDPSIDLMIGMKYKVEADISNCFPSIYSHSIPWALVGKEEAKKNAKKNTWYNIFDNKVIKLKRNETNGLLIGPHSSNLISELILTAIDKELYGRGYRFVRFIDDYNCFVKTYDEAEKFLLDLSQALKEYELSLNTKKTKISPLPISDNDDWVNTLKEYCFSLYKDKNDKKEYITLSSLRTFLNIVVNLAKESNNASILNYAIKIIAKQKFKKYTIDYYIKRMHHLVLLYPYLIRQLDKYIFDKFHINTEIIKKIGDDLFMSGLNKHSYEICSYVLYWSIKYNYYMDKSYSKDAIASKDCIFLTHAWYKSKLEKNKDNIKQLEDYAKELKDNNLMDKYWLFIYETLPKENFDTDWKSIKNKGISFLKNIEEIRNKEILNKEE
ncbi:MAG: RNA-directed DNA polymerase [Bacteroidales bacterium]|nr:RNA-directed DNA polymerase [Bacteroidales bacterium]